MLQRRFQQMNAELEPAPEFVEALIRQVEAPRPSRAGRPALRRAVALLAALLCLFAAVPALAASVPAANDLLYLVSPELAQQFRPVQRSSVDNGIELSVLSAYIHGDTAEIYLALRDLTGDRVDETTDLFDSYSIRRPFDSSGHCRFVSYDPASKTATFLVSITAFGNRKIAGDKITFSVREFLSRRVEQNALALPLPLAALSQSPARIPAELTGGGNLPEPHAETISALRPAAEPLLSPVDGISISAAGYLDGKLHVQTRLSNILETDNHCFLYLLDDAGSKLQPSYNFYFQEDEGGTRIDYCEFVFDLSPEQAAGYRLYGNFVTNGMLTKGNWQVTFPLENAE